ncbi:protein MAIN-LIKE 2-like [Arachis ipaensis]|uniref:protein MAIN-LIKE 2-like n=1 Tax=Arachis ipaensis TaxID=130454 RepID=UPI0007AF3C27|nr:protein MAIN-LIKE 2-like [Arachis ipaensis]
MATKNMRDRDEGEIETKRGRGSVLFLETLEWVSRPSRLIGLRGDTVIAQLPRLQEDLETGEDAITVLRLNQTSLMCRIRPETHSFVLPVDEVTVILEDVTHIFGLPIDGEPVNGCTDSSNDFLQSQSIAIFGRESVVNSSSKSYIKLGWVQTIRDAEPLDIEESIKRYVRCQIFYLLGSTLFTNKSTAYVHAKYLPLLRDFERIYTYSWGSACLAHLYIALCRASQYDTKEMDDPLNLLFVWAWERLPCIAPVPRQSRPLAEIPVVMRWSHSYQSKAWLSKTVAIFRQEINYMDEPYEGLDIPDELHGHLEVCDIVALLLSFECVEWYPANE